MGVTEQKLLRLLYFEFFHKFWGKNTQGVLLMQTTEDPLHSIINI